MARSIHWGSDYVLSAWKAMKRLSFITPFFYLGPHLVSRGTIKMGYCSVLVLVILASISPFSLGGCCPNACSGHGSCDVSDACTCYSNWQNGENSNEAGDCGSRRCPFEIAWSDAPTADGRYHKYAECANEGICNRETGECECFEG